MSNEPYIVKLIKKSYDIKVSSFVTFPDRLIKVTVIILFTPKKITVTSPYNTKSAGVWYYNPNTKKSNFYNFIYVRGDNMPILKYTQEEYEFDNYLEYIGHKEYERALREILEHRTEF
jgi:hypothetical protein